VEPLLVFMPPGVVGFRYPLKVTPTPDAHDDAPRRPRTLAGLDCSVAPSFGLSKRVPACALAVWRRFCRSHLPRRVRLRWSWWFLPLWWGVGAVCLACWRVREDDDLLDGEGRFNLQAGLLNLGELIDASDSRGRGAGRATASTTSSLPEPKRTNHAGVSFRLPRRGQFSDAVDNAEAARDVLDRAESRMADSLASIARSAPGGASGLREGGRDRRTRGNLSSPNPNPHFGPFEAETGDLDQDLPGRQDGDREVADLKCLRRSYPLQHHRTHGRHRLSTPAGLAPVDRRA
jgi:hypothetical protein